MVLLANKRHFITQLLYKHHLVIDGSIKWWSNRRDGQAGEQGWVGEKTTQRQITLSRCHRDTKPKSKLAISVLFFFVCNHNNWTCHIVAVLFCLLSSFDFFSRSQETLCSAVSLSPPTCRQLGELFAESSSKRNFEGDGMREKIEQMYHITFCIQSVCVDFH